jgi:ubiquinone/menaquinone biosynthesis C-methylase UbiE
MVRRRQQAARADRMMPETQERHGKHAAGRSPLPVDLLACPVTRAALSERDGVLVSADGRHRYAIHESGIPLFARDFASDDARTQEAHYERIAQAYQANLRYPHTQEYMAYLDEALFREVGPAPLGTMAELCCGHGEALQLFEGRYAQAVGVDISLSMLLGAPARRGRVTLVQGDATMLPLAGNAFDSVVMLGGIHHVRDRATLFREIARILKPGGRFIYREPVSDFALWRWIRAVVYRVSPALDHTTERPLLHEETVPVLEQVGLASRRWVTVGFFGFCAFMNSDVLVVNRLFRFVPGIRAITRAAANLDDWLTRRPALARAGLQVIGVAEKPVRAT